MSAQDKTARPDASPVSEAEFAACLASLKPSRTIAVAFSGGPDSLALLVLAARWAARRRGTKLIALTVDHGLRAASAAEAKEAGRLARHLGVSHRILKWTDAKPVSGVQAAARSARYALLLAACRDLGAGDLLVAHHLEDQAETFLLRLARGSGVDGLAAMPQMRALGENVRLLRPLLDMPRARLLATVALSGLMPILDPSNENERFDRVKARKALALLAPLGLDAPRLVRTAGHMARARAALEAETGALLTAHALLSPFGDIEMESEALAGAPSEIGLRALAAVTRIVGGGDYGPRMEALEGLYAAVVGGTLGRGRTLNGVKFAFRNDVLIVTRELAAAQKAPALVLKAGEEGLWDGRFHIRIRKARRGARFAVRLLGREGLAALRAANIDLPERRNASLLTLPGLWQGNKLVAAPHFGTLDQGVETTIALRDMSGAMPAKSAGAGHP